MKIPVTTMEALSCFKGDGVKMYQTEEGIYIVGSNDRLNELYDDLLNDTDLTPRYEIHPLMNAKRNYGIEIRDGKFAIVIAEILVEKILK